MTERYRRIERLKDIESEVVLPPVKRLNAELRAIEVGEGHKSQRSGARGQKEKGITITMRTTSTNQPVCS